ncbi:MAG: peptidoglycan DD-metalloendopeptidase family protein [Chloroflexi bacterium]|nr:peptidoglycan DD-metalloendopeptidase family protein [Chloroflexota bacterium]
MKKALLLLALSVAAVLALQIFSLAAQDAQCGTVDVIQFPVDTATFQMVQGFGVPSPRHNGRYHSGEDWFGGRDTSLGQPVEAIARGRVTYSSPRAWGRDGGVVIIEHLMPDGSTIYSLYGHLMERGDILFPARYTCVEIGQIIGAIADVRPAPHVHFEIRVSGSDLPGAGYEWEDPRTLGLREPSAFITDWLAWLSAAHEWHITFADAPRAAPLLLNDNSLLTLNGPYLRRVLPDGRILWRSALEKTTVGIVGFEGAPLLVFSDGTLQRVDYDGNLGESWSLQTTFDSPPLALGDGRHVLHTADNALIAVSANWREIVWRLEGVRPYLRAYAGTDLLAFVSVDHEALLVSREGQRIGRAQLRADGAFAADVAYTRGGLWRISPDGDWTLAVDVVSQSNDARALAVRGSSVYGFDGRAFFAYNDQLLSWQAPLFSQQPLLGWAQLTLLENTLLLISASGHAAAVAAADGTFCASLRVWNTDAQALLWHNLGSDGLLRLMIGSTLFALDWEEFSC